MGTYAALLAALSQQGQGNQGATGFTNPGGGLPQQQGLYPQLPQQPMQNRGVAGPSMMPQGNPQMPQGASGQPQNAMASIMNNPQLMKLLQQHAQQNQQPGQPAQQSGTQTGNGAMGPYSQVVASPAQMGPFTQAQTASGTLPGASSPQTSSLPAWLQQWIGGGQQ